MKMILYILSMLKKYYHQSYIFVHLQPFFSSFNGEILPNFRNNGELMIVDSNVRQLCLNIAPR